MPLAAGPGRGIGQQAGCGTLKRHRSVTVWLSEAAKNSGSEVSIGNPGRIGADRQSSLRAHAFKHVAPSVWSSRRRLRRRRLGCIESSIKRGRSSERRRSTRAKTPLWLRALRALRALRGPALSGRLTLPATPSSGGGAAPSASSPPSGIYPDSPNFAGRRAAKRAGARMPFKPATAEQRLEAMEVRTHLGIA